MTTKLANKLGVLREFQNKYPKSHVGGSIGLMLHSVDLERNLDDSDLDITIDKLYDIKELSLQSQYVDKHPSSDDVDYTINKTINYTRTKIRVNPEPGYDVITYEGYKYHVSKLENILFWKRKYAQKGIYKHQNDLKLMLNEYPDIK